MTLLALAHRATGVLYSSHWPKGGQTWRSLSELNVDEKQVVPWLVGLSLDATGAGADVRAPMYLFDL